jgi:ketosteroid isomerase-like protein
MQDETQRGLIDLAHAWDSAMVENDADAIGSYMAEDWVIIGPDGTVGDKSGFLALVKSGALSHDVMTSENLNVRVYGDTAVVMAQGVSGGMYRGLPFHELERSSCVFIKQDGHWRCVLTHLSRLAEKGNKQPASPLAKDLSFVSRVSEAQTRGG